MSESFNPDPLGQDWKAAVIVAVLFVQAIAYTVWTNGPSIEPYRWAGGTLPMWADLLLLTIVLPMMLFGFFVVFAAIFRMGDSDDE